MAEPKVLVVGAGPVGLSMAAELQRYGVAHRIIDFKAGTGTQSRALTVHARTLEILGDMGLARAVLDSGRKLYGGSIFAQGRRIAQLSFEDLEGETPYPFLISLEQDRVEALLEAHLKELGGAVEWGWRLVDLLRNATGVRVQLEGPGGAREECDFDYLIACDGAHSTCRKAVGASFSGGSYGSEFLLADVKLDWAHPPDELYAYLNESGIFFAAPLAREDYWRVICELPREERALGQEDEASSAHRNAPSLDDLQRLIRIGGPTDLRASDPIWLSWFRVHHRILPQFRKDRIFFAGDAAHIHSPLGGQGMNTGIQDAHNLAWKLALVLQGRGRPVLLDSYDAERRPIGEEVVSGTDAAFKAVLLRHPLARQLRDRLMSFVSSVEPLRRRVERRLAMLYVDYANSPIVAEKGGGLLDEGGLDQGLAGVNRWRAFHKAPSPGEWAPDGQLQHAGAMRQLHAVLPGGCHRLLLFAGEDGEPDAVEGLKATAADIASRYPGLVSGLVILRRPAGAEDAAVAYDPGASLHRRYGARTNSLYLLRPDGYIAFRSQPIDREALVSYLDGTVFSLPVEAAPDEPDLGDR